MMDHINSEIGLAYLNGELDSAQRMKLEQHLVQCASCVRELDERRRVHEAFQTAVDEQVVPRPERPSWYALQAEKERGKSPRPIREIPWRVVMVGMVALLVGMVWVAGGPFLSQTVEPAADVVLTRPLGPDVVAVVTATPTVVSDVEPVVAATAVVVAEPIVVIETNDEMVSSQSFVSAAGRVAFSVDGTTYIEDVPQSGVYLEVGNMQIIGWARDAESLLLSDDIPLHLFNLYIWRSTENKLTAVTEQVEAVAEYGVLPWPTLSPDGQQIWFSDLLEPFVYVFDVAEASIVQTFFDSGDFVNRSFTRNDLGELVVPFTDRCGTGCGDLNLYDVDQAEMHSFGYYSLGYDVFPEQGSFGYAISLNEVVTSIHRIDLETFETAMIGSVAPDAIWRYGVGEAARPHTSPTGAHLAFEVDEDVWEMMDSEGRSFGRQEKAVILDWRRGGGPVLAQETAEGLPQLVYWEPDYQKFPRVFVQPRAFDFVWGKWDEQGELFVYLAQDETAGANYLYAWRPEAGAPELIHAVSLLEKVSDLVWLPDGSGFYFKQGVQLWLYRLDEGAARPLVIENR